MNYSSLGLKQLWELAAHGDNQALQELIRVFDPMIASESKIHGYLDEDVASDVRREFIQGLRAEFSEWKKFHE